MNEQKLNSNDASVIKRWGSRMDVMKKKGWIIYFSEGLNFYRRMKNLNACNQLSMDGFSKEAREDIFYLFSRS